MKVERIDVLIKSKKEVVDFPCAFKFANNTLVLTFHRGQHYGDPPERPVAAISRDWGNTWADLPQDNPLSDSVENSGLVGEMHDGSIIYVDTFPKEAPFSWDPKYLPYHAKRMTTKQTWRVRRFAADTKLAEEWEMHLQGQPWADKPVTYELYGSILELPDGDWLAPFLVHREPYRIETVNGKRHGIVTATVMIGRSSDHGRTFKYVTHFDPYGENGEKIGSEGCCEPDIARLPNGDIICVMRTGSEDASTLHLARSTDGGKTWTKPESIGWPGVKPKLRVLANGVVVITTGRGPFGHPFVTSVILSVDGTGKHWEAPFNFYTGPGCNYTWNLDARRKTGGLLFQFRVGKTCGDLRTSISINSPGRD